MTDHRSAVARDSRAARPLRRELGALLCMLIAMLLLPSAASAAPVSTAAAQISNVYRIQTVGTSGGAHKCLYGTSSHAVYIGACSSSSSQKWQFGQVNGENEWINLANGGYVLGASSLTNGARVSLKALNSGDSAQHFLFIAEQNKVAETHNENLVLAVNSYASGQPVYIKTYSGVGGQKWEVIRLS